MKMKPMELVSLLRQINEAMEREESYIASAGEGKFTPQVAIAMAKNKRKLEEEVQMIAGIEEKNKKLAETKDIPLEELKEQRDFMDTELDVDLTTVTEGDISGCSGLTSKDFYVLLFMTEEKEEKDA